MIRAADVEPRPPAPGGQPLLAVRDLGVRLRRDGRDNALVTGVSFTLHAGETLALVGESGSGKSLTAAALMQLFGPNGRSRQLSSTGTLAFTRRDGSTVDLGQLNERELEDLRGRDIGYIAQDPLNALNPTMRVADQAIEARVRHLSETRAAARDAVLHLFADVGFPDPAAVAPLFPHQLSGGMKQRVMIAVALAAEPRLVIADEPTTALDVTIQAQVLATLARLRRERNLALLFISHDLRVVARIADHVAIMYCGAIVEQGPAATVFAHPAHPYTADLMASAPILAREVVRLQAIRGTPADSLNRPAGCAYLPRCRQARPGLCDRSDLDTRSLGADRSVRCALPLGPADVAIAANRQDIAHVSA